MRQKLRDDFATDAGMLCIWNPSAFGMIDDYDSWEKELLEDSDIRRHIKSGNFVPVNIGSDGCWGVEVRVGTSGAPEVLTDRESKYVVVSSEPYLDFPTIRGRGKGRVSYPVRRSKHVSEVQEVRQPIEVCAC